MITFHVLTDIHFTVEMLAKENLDEEKLVKLVGDSMENGKALYPSNLGKDLSDDMRSKLTLLQNISQFFANFRPPNT